MEALMLFDYQNRPCHLENGSWWNPDGRVCLYPFDSYPILQYFYSDWELNFDLTGIVQWMKDYYALSYLIPLGYILFIHRIWPRITRQPFQPMQYKGLLAVWNLFLSVFSLVGFFTLGLYLFPAFAQRGYYETVCWTTQAKVGYGVYGFWTAAFALSKVAELIDTLFLLLQKKPVNFLHWYHHATVLWYCWDGYVNQASSGIYFAVINYGVHALMYFYYFLTAMGHRPTWAQMVTNLQITQMFMGIGICLSTFYYKFYATGCSVTDRSLYAGLVIYGSYLILFMDFAAKRYSKAKTA
jgi:hypothetical protein